MSDPSIVIMVSVVIIIINVHIIIINKYADSFAESFVIYTNGKKINGPICISDIFSWLHQKRVEIVNTLFLCHICGILF